MDLNEYLKFWSIEVSPSYPTSNKAGYSKLRLNQGPDFGRSISIDTMTVLTSRSPYPIVFQNKRFSLRAYSTDTDSTYFQQIPSVKQEHAPALVRLDPRDSMRIVCVRRSA